MRSGDGQWWTSRSQRISTMCALAMDDRDLDRAAGRALTPAERSARMREIAHSLLRSRPPLIPAEYQPDAKPRTPLLAPKHAVVYTVYT